MKNIDNKILYTIPALFVRTHKAIKYIPFEQILYLKAEGSYTSIVVKEKGKQYMSSLTLGQVEQKMNCPYILRIHRSYMVNLKQISGMVGKTVKIGADIIPIGRNYRHVLDNFVII